MYANYFGLRSLPFEDRADTQFFYPTAEREEALAALEYEIHHGTGFGLLIGETGAGKTLLLRTLLLRLQQADQAVVVTWPAAGEMDLVRECCKGFGVTLPSLHNEVRCINRLRRHLGRCVDSGKQSILIVDQAENLSPTNIAQLATLADLSGNRGKLLTIILSAQPRVRTLLDRPEFARIRQQLFGERTLSSLTANETNEYIRHRLRIAGAADIPLFDDRAISDIHEISGGIPRLINRICNAAMLVAYGAQSPRITRTIVEEAIAQPAVQERTVEAKDLGLPTIGEGGAPWLSGSESPEPTANRVDAQRSMSPFESSLTQAAIYDHDEAPDTGPDANESGGASIADAEFEQFGAESPVSKSHKGTIVLAQLEQAMVRAQRMSSNIEALLSRLPAMEKLLASLVKHYTGDIEARLVRASEIAERTEDSARRVEHACALANDVESRLTEFAERLADKADDVQHRVTTLMNGLPSTEAAQTRLAALIDQAASATRTSEDTITTFRSQTRTTVEESERELQRRAGVELDRYERQVQERIKSCERAQQRLTADSLDRHSAALRDQLISLEQNAQESLKSSQSKIDATLRQVASAAGDAERVADSLTAKFKAAIAESEQNVKLVADNLSDRCREEMAELTDSAASRARQIEQQLDNVAARQADARSALSDATNKIEAITTQVFVLSDNVRDAKTVVDDLPTQVQTLTRPLVDNLQRGAQLLQNVQATGERVIAIQQQVASSLIDIGIGCERVSVARAQAGEYQQIVAAQDGCQTAAKKLEAAVGSARQIHDALQGLVAHADEKVDRLASHHASARNVLDQLCAANIAGRQVIDGIEETTTKSHAQIDLMSQDVGTLTNNAQSVIDLLANKQEQFQGFATHADALGERIEELAVKASEVQASVANWTEGPSTIVENAQTQAAQLERVCSAVRKVFANLADATLQAQRQAEELRGTGEDTSNRLANLTAETHRATQSLHEWVEEAVRTQSRLERTLSECPTIGQTHPAEAVRRLSRPVEPFARIPSGLPDGQLQMLTEPNFDPTLVESRLAKVPTRAEEIARLISEAKHQEIGAPS